MEPYRYSATFITIVPTSFRYFCLVVFSWLALTALASRPASADVSRPNQEEGPTRVSVAVFVLDLDAIYTPTQSFEANVYLEYHWRDRRLAHDGPNEVPRPRVEVWHPRLQIVNQQKVWQTFPDIVEISPNGEVVYRQRVWGSFSQPLELQEFPFDRQVFTIQFAAAGYAPDEIDLVPDPGLSGIASRLSIPDWDVSGWNIESKPFVPGPAEELPAAGFIFSIEAKRRSGYFIVQVIIPLFFIVAMSWVVFWIDPKETGTQISVAITTMLTLIAYRFAVGTALPKISYLSRLDYFILASTILVFSSLIEVMITSTLAKGGKLELARTIDTWSRWLFPMTFVLVSLETLVFRIVFK